MALSGMCEVRPPSKTRSLKFEKGSHSGPFFQDSEVPGSEQDDYVATGGKCRFYLGRAPVKAKP
jgi:hypothetical protein